MTEAAEQVVAVMEVAAGVAVQRAAGEASRAGAVTAEEALAAQPDMHAKRDPAQW